MIKILLNVLRIEIALLCIIFMSTCTKIDHVKITPEQWFHVYNGKERLEKKLCDTPQLFYVSNEIPREYVEPIVKGFLYWNKVTGIELFEYGGLSNHNESTRTEDGSLLVAYSDSYDDFGICGLAHGTLDLDRSCVDGGIVYIAKRCLHMYIESHEQMESLARHEAGHILGLQHVPYNKNDVMYKNLLPESKEYSHPIPIGKDILKELIHIYKK